MHQRTHREVCQHIDDVLNGQAPLIDETPAAVEEEAQRIAAQLLARGGGDAKAVHERVTVDVASLELTRPRSRSAWGIQYHYQLFLYDVPTGLRVHPGAAHVFSGDLLERAIQADLEFFRSLMR